MCGIAGWSYPKEKMPPFAGLRGLARALAHRGPDGEGFYENAQEGVALAHRRLSIIDLSDASSQPMLALDGQVVLSYNGELYNFRELRDELIARGATFTTTGDTEVVLNAYLEWGIACVDKFAGMFAFALWDGRSKTLHLARDAMGIKPLYWMMHDGGLVFASEAKALGALPGVRLTLRDAGVAQYLEFGYVIEEERTIFEKVHKVPPGMRLSIREGCIVERRTFFSPATQPSNAVSFDDRVDELYGLLNTVVSQHLIADVPVAMLLSGGLDSSVIAALAARHGQVETLTMAFEGESLDERPFAQKVASYVGARFQQVLITPQQVIAELETNTAMMDDLFADWGTITSRLLYRKAKELGYKVVLVGEGADELFGGYGIFDVDKKLSKFAQFRLYQRYAGRRHGACRALFSEIFGDYLRTTTDAFDAVRLFESRRQLPNQYVMKVDKASMAESIEARAPFLDRRIAEFAYSIPREYLLDAQKNKAVLRTVASRFGLLPEEISNRIKHGAPLDAQWMDSSAVLRARARAKLLHTDSLTSRYGLRKPMEAYLVHGREGEAWPQAISIYRNLAWKLLLLEHWGEKVLSRPAVDTQAEFIDVVSAQSVAHAHSSAEANPPITVNHLNDATSSPPLVSTIIPVYNRPEMIVRAVQSVLEQTYRPIEIIIVDDGSRDETPAVCKRLAEEHPAIIRFFQQPNQGPGRARQYGVEMSRGEFVQFLDSDDRFLPEKTALLMNALTHDNYADIAYGKTWTVLADESREVDKAHRTHEAVTHLFPTILSGRLWPTNVPLYRRGALARIGAWPSTRQLEDLLFDSMAGAARARLVHVDAYVAEVWAHDGEHLGTAWRKDPVSHAQRADALLEILKNAARAGVSDGSLEMQRFCRTLFLEARWAAESGLTEHAHRLMNAAHSRAIAGKWQYAAFRAASNVIGWRGAGKLASFSERLRLP